MNRHPLSAVKPILPEDLFHVLPRHLLLRHVDEHGVAVRLNILHT